MTPYWKSIIIYVTILVSEPDDGKVNHLLKMRLPNNKDYLGSYTGPFSLGAENSTVRVRLESVECEEVIGCEEHPVLGPIGYQAWICNIDKATLTE
jgi:hypothetical protein